MSSNPRPLRRPRPFQRSLPEPPPLPSRPSSNRQLPAPPAPAAIPERKARAPAPLPMRLEPVVEGDARLLREIRKPLPGDGGVRRRGSSPALSRQRSQYFEQVFGSLRDDASGYGYGEGPREKAVVLAEVKTNVFVADEMLFVTNLSEHLSRRYARPVSSTAVTLQHGACLLLGGSLEPAYIVAIHGLPSLVQTATNKRNATLLQRHLHIALGIAPTRGVVRFVAVPEECLASGGKTVAGELADGKRVSGTITAGDDGSGVGDNGGRVDDHDGKVQRRRTLRTLSRLKSVSSSSQQPAMETSTGSVRTEVPSSPSHDASLESARGHLRRSSTVRPRMGTEQAAESRRGARGLRQKKSSTFIQSLFGRTRQDPSVIQPAIQEEQQ